MGELKTMFNTTANPQVNVCVYQSTMLLHIIQVKGRFLKWQQLKKDSKSQREGEKIVKFG